MKRPYTYRPNLVLIRRGRKTRSAREIRRRMQEKGIEHAEAYEEVLNEWMQQGKIRRD